MYESGETPLPKSDRLTGGSLDDEYLRCVANIPLKHRYVRTNKKEVTATGRRETTPEVSRRARSGRAAGRHGVTPGQARPHSASKSMRMTGTHRRASSDEEKLSMKAATRQQSVHAMTGSFKIAAAAFNLRPSKGRALDKHEMKTSTA